VFVVGKAPAGSNVQQLSPFKRQLDSFTLSPSNSENIIRSIAQML
jgi:hypothetical protein